MNRSKRTFWAIYHWKNVQKQPAKNTIQQNKTHAAISQKPLLHKNIAKMTRNLLATKWSHGKQMEPAIFFTDKQEKTMLTGARWLQRRSSCLFTSKNATKSP